MLQTLYATFPDSALAERAVGALLDYGADALDISVVTKEVGGPGSQETTLKSLMPTENGNHTTALYNDDEASRSEASGKTGLSATTPGDAMLGAEKGAGIGLGVGALAGLASMVIPGVGLVMGGGALAVAIAGAVGATAAGAVAGGVTGYLKDQGVSEDASLDYHRAYENGSAVLSVKVPSGNLTHDDAMKILSKYLAADIRAFGPTVGQNKPVGVAL